MPVPPLYAKKYLGRVVGQALLILLMIEMIFITEKLNDVLGTAVSQNVDVKGTMLLMLYRMPEIFSLAVPMALLAASYRVTLRFREERELLALSGIGVGTYRMLLLICGVGVAALVVSFLVAGFISPATAFAQRSLLFNSYVGALRGNVTNGQFYQFSDYIILARHSRDQTTAGQLFLYQKHSNQSDEDRVVVARRASLGAPRADGVVVMHLEDFDSVNFRPIDPYPNLDNCKDCRSPAEPASVVKVGNFDQQLDFDDLLRFDPRGKNPSEWTLADGLGLGSSGLVPGPREVAEIGHRLVRSLLCVIAPLIAGLALAFTTRRTHVVALPLACAALMGLDVSMAFFVDEISTIGAVGSVVAILTVIAVVALSAVAVGLKVQDAIVRPALART